MHEDDWELDEPNVATPTMPRWTPRAYTNNGTLDDADKAKLINHGAEVYDGTVAPLVGKVVPRPGDKNSCLYHSLLQTNDATLATAERTDIANFIFANENMQIGNLTFFESIRAELGNSINSADYRDHMTGLRPFPGSSGTPWAGLPETIAFSSKQQRRVEVFTEFPGGDGTKFRAEWGYGDLNHPKVFILHNGSHFNNIEPGAPTSPRRRQETPPDELVGRKVMKEYGKSGWAFGRVTSYQLPSPTDTAEVAAEGIYFRVKYDDKDQADYTRQQLEDIMLPPGYSDTRNIITTWKKLKAKYDSVGAELRKHQSNGTSLNSSITNVAFLRETFSFRPDTAINDSNIQKKAQTFFKLIHPDKTEGLPKRIRFVAARLGEAIRYIVEAFKKLSNPGAPI